MYPAFLLIIRQYFFIIYNFCIFWAVFNKCNPIPIYPSFLTLFLCNLVFLIQRLYCKMTYCCLHPIRLVIEIYQECITNTVFQKCNTSHQKGKLGDISQFANQGLTIDGQHSDFPFTVLYLIGLGYGRPSQTTLLPVPQTER